MKAVDRRLTQALYDFNANEVRKALRAGADPNLKLRTYDNWVNEPISKQKIMSTPLHELPAHDVCIVDALTYTIGRHMYKLNGGEIFDALLGAGADVNHRTGIFKRKFKGPFEALIFTRDYPDFKLATQANFNQERTRLLEALVSYGVDCLRVTKTGGTILHSTCYELNLERLEWLSGIESFLPHFKTMLHTKSNDGFTPLTRMTSFLFPGENREAIYNNFAVLVKHGAEINIRISNDGNVTVEEEFLANNFHDTWRRLVALQASVKNTGLPDGARRPKL